NVGLVGERVDLERVGVVPRRTMNPLFGNEGTQDHLVRLEHVPGGRGFLFGGRCRVSHDLKLPSSVCLYVCSMFAATGLAAIGYLAAASAPFSFFARALIASSAARVTSILRGFITHNALRSETGATSTPWMFRALR